jgi:hypothetical protein
VHAPGRALKKARTGTGFEPRDRAAHRRGGDPEFARRGGEPAAIDDADKYPQIVQV